MIQVFEDFQERLVLSAVRVGNGGEIYDPRLLGFEEAELAGGQGANGRRIDLAMFARAPTQAERGREKQRADRVNKFLGMIFHSRSNELIGFLFTGRTDRSRQRAGERARSSPRNSPALSPLAADEVAEART